MSHDVDTAKIHLANANRNSNRKDPIAEASIAQAHALISISEQIAEATKLTTQLLAEIRDRITREDQEADR